MTTDKMIRMLTADSGGWPTELDPQDKEWLVAKLRAAEELVGYVEGLCRHSIPNSYLMDKALERYRNAGKGEG